jgi:osmotically-inducible protein OsmY
MCAMVAGKTGLGAMPGVAQNGAAPPPEKSRRGAPRIEETAFVPFASRHAPFLVAALLAAGTLPGCVAVVAAGAAGGGYAASQERGIGGQVNDTAISAQIQQKWREYNPDMAKQLTLTVYQGRVLIVGPVSNPDFRDEAVKRAWQVQGVNEVDNDIEVAAQQRFSDEAKDALITSKLRSALVLDSEIRSLNYNIDTVNGAVYLTGSARSQAELERAIDHARNISNVRKVVSFVKIRSGETTASGAAPAPQPAASPAGSSAASAPAPAPMPPASGPTPGGNAPVEVKPLQ